jgi:dTMP kinase
VSERRGALIVLEGIDGSGTTTQSARLVDALGRRGYAAHLTREPSNGPVGTLIRQALSRRLVVPSAEGARAPGFATMALLFAADRMDHLEAEILPRLARGEVVVCDRYDHSSLVYQAATSDDPEAVAAWTRELNRHARRPDLVLILDVDPAEAKRRRSSRGGGEEIFDADPLQRALAEGYRQCPRHFPGEPMVLVDASRSIDEVGEELERRVVAHLESAMAPT